MNSEIQKTNAALKSEDPFIINVMEIEIQVEKKE